MKSLNLLTKEDIKDIKLVCFDVDGVTVKKGTKIEEIEGKDQSTLIVKTVHLLPETRDKLIALKKYFYIAISSGRSSLYLTQVFSELLWERVALVSENGIFTLKDGLLTQNEQFGANTLAKMAAITHELKKLDGVNPSFTAFEPKQFLITLHAKSEMKEVKEIVKRIDPEGEFYLQWNGEAFDIAPKRINKGLGIIHLAKAFKIDVSQTMAIGNGPNDIEMVETAGIGVTTEPKVIQEDFATSGYEFLGGIELIDKLLELLKDD